MIVTVGEALPRQARGHIGDGCVKWKHFLNDVADVADQTGTVRGRIKRVEMSLKPCFHMIVAVIVSICRRLIGDTSPMCRSRSPTVTIIWKPGFKLDGFKCLSTKKIDGFQSSLSCRRHHFGLLNDILKIAYGNKTYFAKYQVTFWLALPSWLRKLSSNDPAETLPRQGKRMTRQKNVFLHQV